MIDIKHNTREMKIPQAEKILNYSSFVYRRVFRIQRHLRSDSGDILDLDDFTYVLNYKRHGETVMHHSDLIKTNDENYVYLKWTIDRGCTEIPGNLSVEVMGVKDGDKETYFTSEPGVFIVSEDIAADSVDLLDPSKYLLALLSKVNAKSVPVVNGLDWIGDITEEMLSEYGIPSINNVLAHRFIINNIDNSKQYEARLETHNGKPVLIYKEVSE